MMARRPCRKPDMAAASGGGGGDGVGSDDGADDPLTGEAWDDPVVASDGFRYSLPFLRRFLEINGNRSPMIPQRALRPVAVRHPLLRRALRLPPVDEPLAFLPGAAPGPLAVRLPLAIGDLSLRLQTLWLSMLQTDELEDGVLWIRVPLHRAQEAYRGGLLQASSVDLPAPWRKRAVLAAAEAGPGLVELLADPMAFGRALVCGTGLTVEELELDENHAARKYRDAVQRARRDQAKSSGRRDKAEGVEK